jgi:2-C-methyl-D-erythritol 4-phosphate cytidylyltransferase / 2-C-methyl-D-erythritol 2,4-cyclodiphosphate synthase
MRVAALLAAAGSSARMGAGPKKEYRLLPDGLTVLEHSVSVFADAFPGADLVVVVPPDGSGEARAALTPASQGRVRFVDGGSTRQGSVMRGLEALARTETPPDIVLVHDAARPWITRELAKAVAEKAAESGACVPVVPTVDTMKRLDADGTIVEHLARDGVFAVQTPQGFSFAPLLAAHKKAALDGTAYTDDAEIWARYVGPVSTVPGDRGNLKVTFPGDLGLAAPPVSVNAGSAAFRVGSGWDIHRLVEGRRLLVGGVEIPFEKGEDGHSDGDVLIHAVIDALLGASALGDIGAFYPPGDERYRNISSRVLLRDAVSRVSAAGWRIENLDCTVVLERPKIRPRVDEIRETLAADLGIPVDAVSVKGKTNEGVDAVGEGRAVEAYAVCLAVRLP